MIEQVGPYQVIEAIGAGGSARVDLARIDRAYNFQRHVVLKRPLEHLRQDPRTGAALRREARIGGRLHHPHLIAVLDAGVHDGYDYLVVEYVHGGSLRVLMEAAEPDRVREVPLGVALAIVADVARGLHHAHELADEDGSPLGLVHRDVAPGNVLVGLDGTVKLADFGIAKETRVTTLSGSLRGTVTYMAPELCRGHAFDRRADVFSLGVILYELVTGARLFRADSDVAALHRVLSGIVPRPRELAPAIDRALEAIVLRALASEPASRFATALELAGAIERWASAAREQPSARAIARWVASVIGARDVPWIGAATVPEAPRGEGSLVELIAATGDEDQPVDERFGPEPPAEPPQAAQAAPAPRRRGRAVIAGVIASGLAAGAIATWAAMADPSEPTASAAPPPTSVRAVTPAPVATPPVPDEPVATSAPPPVETPARARSIDDLDAARERPAHTHQLRGRGHQGPRSRTRTGRPRRGERARAARTEPTTSPPSGAGSAPPAKREPSSAAWDPTLLLPTDKKP